MAMPASGCIALRTCITGCACSSISCAVANVACSPASLSSLSVQASKTAPHCMREFYGYAPVVNTCLNISPISTNCNISTACVCGCLQPSTSVPIGDCYYPNYGWQMFANNSNVTSAIVCIRCNNVQIYCCSVSGKVFSCSGSWTTTARRVDYNDLIHIVTCVSNGVEGDSVNASIYVSSITQCVGTYCRGTTFGQYVDLGEVPPE